MINSFEQKALNNTVDLSIFDKHLFLKAYNCWVYPRNQSKKCDKNIGNDNI